MSKKLKKKVPELRFPEFADDWVDKKLRDVFTRITRKNTENNTNVLTISAQNGLINQKEFFNKSVAAKDLTGYYLLNKGEFAYNKSYSNGYPMGAIKRLYRYSKGVVSPLYICFSSSNEIECQFYDKYFDGGKLNSELSKIAQEGARNHGLLNISVVEFFDNLNIFYPSLAEQEKIAGFLGSIDSRLTQLRRKSELLQTYKWGVMKKIFSQEVRFKQVDGISFINWEDKQLNQLLFEHKNRNYDLSFSKEDVLSVSGNVGIVNQIQHLGRSYAGESVANYHVVNIGDIVYTKSPLKNNPYGIIKANKGKAGIVSTLYAVYSCKQGVLADYLDYYFSIDDNVNGYLRPLVHKGAKNDMKINNQRVLIDSITIPSFEEQKKITNFLIAIDKKIEAVSQQIQKMEQFKKGLLQKMFV